MVVTSATSSPGELGVGGVGASGGECSLGLYSSWTVLDAEGATSWADDAAVLDVAVGRLVGDTLVRLDGPADLFDCTLVFASGTRVVQISTESVPEVWTFTGPSRDGGGGGWWADGPHPVEHREEFMLEPEYRSADPVDRFGPGALVPSAHPSALPGDVPDRLRRCVPMRVEEVLTHRGPYQKLGDFHQVGRLELRGGTETGERCVVELENLWSLSGPGVVLTKEDPSSWAYLAVEALRGKALIGVDGPSDLFDATLIFSDGVRVRQLSTDEDERTWVVTMEGRQVFEGPKPAQHRAAVAGD